MCTLTAHPPYNVNMSTMMSEALCQRSQKCFLNQILSRKQSCLLAVRVPLFGGVRFFSWSCLTFARLSPLCRGAIYAVLRVVPPRGVLVSCIVFFLLKVDAPPETDLLGSFDPLTDRWQPDPARA